MIKNILYLGAICSNEVDSELFSTAKKRTTQPQQKFHKLIISGLKKNGCEEINVFSSLNISHSTHKRKFWNLKNDNESGVNYHYPVCINLPIVKHLIIFFSALFFTIKWCLKHNRKKSIIICDILNRSAVVGVIMAGRLMRFQVMAVVTDLPSSVVFPHEAKNGSILSKVLYLWTNLYINRFTAYILLTKQMNDVINKKNRPFIVMEGLVDIEMKDVEHFPFTGKEKTLMYAGGIYEKYGVRMLINAFRSIQDENYKLLIFGSGDMNEDMAYLTAKDCRLIYKGIVPNTEIIEYEREVSLLVNPRPTHEDFVKYSFPSKNMEYMVSGAPVLTTKLPGMPEEYNEYVYLLEEENETAYAKKITEILSLSNEELQKKGEKAKQFVLREKNNVVQSKRILELAQSCAS